MREIARCSALELALEELDARDDPGSLRAVDRQQSESRSPHLHVESRGVSAGELEQSLHRGIREHSFAHAVLELSTYAHDPGSG